VRRTDTAEEIRAGTSFQIFPGGQNFDRLPRGGAKYEEKKLWAKHKKSLFSKSGQGPPCALPPNDVLGSEVGFFYYLTNQFKRTS